MWQTQELSQYGAQARHFTYNVNTEVCLYNHSCHGKAISITYYECVLIALVSKHAEHLCCSTSSSMDCLVLPYFYTLSYKWHKFWKKKVLNTKCVLLFPLQLLSATFLILKRIKQGSIMNVHRSWCKVPVFLSDFSQILIFKTGFQKIKKYQIS
jgi:hypothetical protein